LKGYEKKKDDPMINEILDSIKKYRSKLKLIGIEDFQVFLFYFILFLIKIKIRSKVFLHIS